MLRPIRMDGPSLLQSGALRTTAVAMMAMLASLRASASSELFFTILHTNDEHSALVPSPLVDYDPNTQDPTVGGFARVSTLVNRVRAAKSAEDEPVVLVSAADILGGAPYFWLIPGGEAPELSIMQQMGYDVVTVGNHEFDYGPEVLAQYYKAAGYPAANATTALVSSNLVIPDGHPLGECGILDTHIMELDNGLTLGFFGYLGQYAAPLALKAPIGIRDSIEAAAEAVTSLREQGADLVIGVTHAALEDDRVIAAAVPDIDILVTGHCHTALHEPERVGKTILVQAGGYLQYLGVLEIGYSPETGALRIRNEESNQPFLLPVDDTVEKDPIIQAAIAEYTAKLDELVHRLTQGRVPRAADHILIADAPLTARPPGRESVLGNFVTDAMRFAVEQETGKRVDLAIQANGVIRGNVNPGTMPHSENRVTFYDLATAVGLGKGADGIPGFPLASLYLTGNEIYRMLEVSLHLAEAYADIFYLQVSGMRFAYDPGRSVLFRVPFTKVSVPTFRAVREVERFTGDGLQEDAPGAFTPISRSDDTLYHVVCDAYILSFFPRIAEMLPYYPVVPKDQDGNPLDMEQAIIQTSEGELKFWQAVVAHVLAQPKGDGELPRVAAHYFDPGHRIAQVDATPLYMWALPVVAVMVVPGVLWRRRRRASA